MLITKIETDEDMKLSELQYKDIINQDITTLKKLVYYENAKPLLTSEVGIVFGGPDMIPKRVEEALNLYNKGLVKKLLLSGGIGYFNFNRKTPEAITLKDYLLKKGFSQEDIIIESSSRNTIENVANSLNILKELYDLNTLTLTIITSDFHLKRSLQLFTTSLKTPKNIQGVGVNTTIKNLLAEKTILLKEALLLIYYVKHHYISDLEVKDISLKRLKKH